MVSAMSMNAAVSTTNAKLEWTSPLLLHDTAMTRHDGLGCPLLTG
jgi:hypothetical protein